MDFFLNINENSFQVDYANKTTKMTTCNDQYQSFFELFLKPHSQKKQSAAT